MRASLQPMCEQLWRGSRRGGRAHRDHDDIFCQKFHRKPFSDFSSEVPLLEASSSRRSSSCRGVRLVGVRTSTRTY